MRPRPQPVPGAAGGGVVVVVVAVARQRPATAAVLRRQPSRLSRWQANRLPSWSRRAASGRHLRPSPPSLSRAPTRSAGCWAGCEGLGGRLQFLKELDHLPSELARRRGAAGDAHAADATEPLRLDLFQGVDQVGGLAAFLLDDLDQPLRVGGAGAADDDDQVDVLGRLDGGLLPLLGRPADLVVNLRLGVAEPDLLDQVVRVPDRERGLAGDRDLLGGDRERFDVGGLLDQVDFARAVADGPSGSGWPRSPM